jgi:hypothetical protein
MQLEMLSPRHTSVRFTPTLATRLATSLMVLCSCAWGAPKPDPAALFRSLPLRFEQDAKGAWSARGAKYAIGFSESSVSLRVPDGLVRLSFEGARSMQSAKWDPSGKMLAPTNYFKGGTFRSADAFSNLRRPNLYPGIDVVYHGRGGRLEYDFNLAPRADPSRIRMRFEGVDRVSLDDSGALVLKTASGDIIQQLPMVYQERPSGEVITVSAAYRLAADGSVGVSLGKYDRTQALVIDPSILYDFWFTGSNAQEGISLGHDGQGYEYIAGWTYSPDFSAGAGGYDPNYNSDRDCWMVKFNAFATSGEAVILYSTYLGGNFDDDMRSMAVDSSGNAYLGGTTISTDFPVTANAYQNMLPNTSVNLNGFVTMLNTNLPGVSSLIYSTYYGGADNLVINGVAAFQDQIYATGWTVTPDLPTSAGVPFQPTLNGSYDSFVAIFNPGGADATSSLTYASYLGGSAEDVGRSIDVDQNGNAYITGYTFSVDFPITSNAFQPSYNDGGGDAFLSIVNPVSGALTYSTFLGGTNIDVATKVQVDQTTGNVAIAGFTFSTDFPLTVNAAQPIYGGGGDAFIATLNPSAATPAAQLVYGTYYGGNDVEVAYDMRYSQGLYYLAGYTFSPNLPVTQNALNPVSAMGGTDGFEAIIDPNNALVYASYITGPGNQVAYAVDYDAAGNIYAAGYATSGIFPNNTPPHNVPGNFDVFFLLVSPH